MHKVEGLALGVVSEPYYINPLLDFGSKAGDGANANGKLFAASLTLSVYSFQGITLGEKVAPGETVISFMYHVPEPYATDIITLEVFSKFSTPDAISGVEDTDYIVHPIDPIYLYLIPEPMTLSLLGLGGLVLLRRHR
ncbi:MAG: PEP-CTERM sorting domain-containing protein [Sedimentisphaerales bacterium]|nr:PEP-CTERM sorting domain-containing protein [Sedimentisphaerales bacterium]